MYVYDVSLCCEQLNTFMKLEYTSSVITHFEVVPKAVLYVYLHVVCMLFKYFLYSLPSLLSPYLYVQNEYNIEVTSLCSLISDSHIYMYESLPLVMVK